LKKTVLAIDIGSTKICAIIADISSDGDIQITGAGISKSNGLKKGSITNIELASKAIKTALSDAKRVAGCDLKRAIVSFSGAYTKSLQSSGIVNVPNKEIGVDEINRVMNTSLYNANIPNEYEVVHTLPFNFKVDDQEFIDDPLGMNASRLEVETHLITTQKSNLNNLKKAVKAAGVEVETVLLSGYASAISVITQDEKELGVGVIDMGGSSSNIVIHAGNSIRYNDFLGVGSNHITNDLSMALYTPLSAAEDVKIKYGSLHTPNNELIELPIIGDEGSKHDVSLEVVHNVIYARVEETLMIIAQSIEKSGLKDQMGAGVVLTGGFTSLEGIRDLAVAIFDNIPVRLAKPMEVDGLFDTLRDPAYSCAIGLVKYSSGLYTPYEIDVNKNMRHSNEKFEETQVDSLNNLKEESATPAETALTKLPEKKPSSNEPNILSQFFNKLSQLF
jgi:cell division protein FtsA